MQLHPWWSLHQAPPLKTRLREEEASTELKSLFSQSVQKRTRCDVPFGLFLSGGLDSSWVLHSMSEAHLHQASGEKIKTFSLSFPSSQVDESFWAHKVAQAFSTEHYTIPFRLDSLALWPQVLYHCDFPHGDISFLPTFCLSQLASQKVKMVLTGDGSDELFAGYDRYAFFAEKEAENPSISLKQWLHHYLFHSPVFQEEELSELLSFPSSGISPLKGIKEAQEELWTFLYQKLQQVEHLQPLSRILYLDSTTLLPFNNLMKPDRMAMAHSLEARSPYMDHHLVEFAFSLPDALKFQIKSPNPQQSQQQHQSQHQKQYQQRQQHQSQHQQRQRQQHTGKYLVKKAAEEALGTEVCYRSKQMFAVPLAEAPQGLMPALFRYLLLKEERASGPYFNQTSLEKYLQLYQQAPIKYLKKLRSLMAMEIWLRLFFQGENPEELSSKIRSQIRTFSL